MEFGRSPGPLGRVLAHASAGAASALVIGLIQVSLAVSFATLVFSGPLEPFLGPGIGFTLFATLAAGLVVALTATVPGTVGNVKGVTSALVAVVASGVAGSMGPSANAEAIFATVVVAIVVTSSLTGLLLLVLGRFRLGDLVRFLPYPVIGGFIAGSGWLLASSSLELLAGAPLAFGHVRSWFEPAAFPRWALALAFALTVLLVTGRSRRAFVVPVTILVALAAFFGWTALTDTSVPVLREGGWVLGPLPAGWLWQPVSWWRPELVDWGAIASQAPAIATIGLVAAMEVLLNATGMEVALRRDVDLDRELRTAGMSSLAAGIGGGMVGYQVLSLTILGDRMGGLRRWSPVLAGVVALAAMIGGSAVLAALPTFVLAGLMTYLGLDFLKTWLVDAWGTVPVVEYLVIVAILITIGVAGILPGVGVGVLASIVLFAIAYGRIDVVRHHLPGSAQPSRVTRTGPEREALKRLGERLSIVHLQGYLFFGTAHRVLTKLRSILRDDDASSLRFVILDFRRVTGIDTTAAHALLNGIKATEAYGAEIVATHLASQVEARLKALADERSVAFHTFADLDRGLEWCEDALLAETPHRGEPDGVDGSNPFGLDPDTWSRLKPFLQQRTLAAGELLVAEGDASDALYVIESGALTAQLDRTDAAPLRLETVGVGHVVGELGFFLRQPRSASVVADVPSRVWTLTRDALAHLEQDDPSTAMAWQTAMSERLSERVTHLMGVVRALER